jgi:hypothetical protein
MRVAGRAIVEAMEQGRSRNDASGRRRLSMAGGRLHPSPQAVAETSSSNKSCQCIELIALSRQYEPSNTCLANRRSTVSRPSRNFA